MRDSKDKNVIFIWKSSHLKVGLPGRGGKGEIPSVIDILEAGLLPNTPWAGEESAEDGVDDIFNWT